MQRLGVLHGVSLFFMIALAGTRPAPAGALSNVAAFMPTSGTVAWGFETGLGNDDLFSNFSHGDETPNSWWRVDLGQAFDVAQLVITSRSGLANRTNGAVLRAYGLDGVTQIGSDLTLSGFGDASPLQIAFDNAGAGWTEVRYFQIGGEGISVPYLHVAEFAAMADVDVFPGFIPGVTATASETWFPDPSNLDVMARHLVDNSGMSDQSGPLGDPGASHRDAHGALWHTDANPIEPTVTFDLGDLCALERMLIWNHNQPGLYARGFKDVLIETSSDGLVFAPLDDRNGDDPGNATIPISPGGDAGYQADVALQGVSARHVRITALASHGDVYWGLSEVRFYGVPEPSTCAIAAAGMLTLVLLGARRRPANNHRAADR
ncbi:MAG: hypothetical protein JW809_15350 [Pirellulales bacterium]|nr:hypothetical protein [Pirellulales bacterium]